MDRSGNRRPVVQERPERADRPADHQQRPAAPEFARPDGGLHQAVLALPGTDLAGGRRHRGQRQQGPDDRVPALQGLPERPVADLQLRERDDLQGAAAGRRRQLHRRHRHAGHQQARNQLCDGSAHHLADRRCPGLRRQCAVQHQRHPEPCHQGGADRPVEPWRAAAQPVERHHLYESTACGGRRTDTHRHEPHPRPASDDHGGRKHGHAAGRPRQVRDAGQHRHQRDGELQRPADRQRRLRR